MAKEELSIDQVVALASSGDESGIALWLESGGNPDQYDAAGWTPLLAAAVRGKAGVVAQLINNSFRQANVELIHGQSGALPIHYAGQAGDVATAKLLLDKCPSHLDRVWLVNGHTLFLQAVFYGHIKLAQFALERGANTAATTLRGLGGNELASQFENQAMVDIIKAHDSSVEEKQAYYKVLLGKIAPLYPPLQRAKYQASDTLVSMIEEGLSKVSAKRQSSAELLKKIFDFIDNAKLDLNYLGGCLQQPPLVVAVTGNNGSPANPEMAAFRLQLARYLLDKGANPTVCEQHPMGVNAVIRAAVFNHLAILQLMSKSISPAALAAALNEQPVVNGLTALHDTVLRASTAGADRFDGYLEQIRWCVAHGARSDIEDYSGRTQRSIGEGIQQNDRRQKVLGALDNS
jgi:ankyrin repeat protein